MTGTDDSYGDKQVPAVTTGAGGQPEPAPQAETAPGPVFSQVFPGVIIGRWVEAPDGAMFEVAEGGWYINDRVARGDTERAAQKTASHSNQSQTVHAHGRTRTTKKGKIKMVKCNDECKVIKPDVNWPGGSMGGRV